ncbi:MAG: helix-turn-helix domain-containing protein [Arenibacterium sp.]
MSEQYHFDRKKGFVALPVDLFDLDLSPGAFRTLTELCRMANADGFCWPSLEQLSDRLGRSRSAISGYIKELRGAELVTTEEQKTANGYNYRLKYQVTFWAAWRASLSPRPVQRNERRVEPVERLLESKNQSLEKQSGENLDMLLKKWQRCFAGAPYPMVARAPNEMLCAETQSALSQPVDAPAPPAKIETQIRAHWKTLSIDVPPAALNAQIKTLISCDLSERELQNLLTTLRKSWPVHWHRCPSDEAFAKLIRTSKITSERRKKDVLRGYYNRWLRAENSLRNRPGSCSVAA